jgi:hypothetical protein
MPAELFSRPDAAVRGEDGKDAVLAVSEALDLLDLHGGDGMIVFRQPRAIVFMPYTQHVHDQDCTRA